MLNYLRYWRHFFSRSSKLSFKRGYWPHHLNNNQPFLSSSCDIQARCMFFPFLSWYPYLIFFSALEVTTEASQPPVLSIVLLYTACFTFLITYNLSDTPYASLSNYPFEPDLYSLTLQCTTSSTPTLIFTCTFPPDSPLRSSSPTIPDPLAIEDRGDGGPRVCDTGPTTQPRQLMQANAGQQRLTKARLTMANISFFILFDLH